MGKTREPGEHRYKNYLIRIRSYQRESGGWIPQVFVFWDEGNTIAEEKLYWDQAFATQAEANSFATIQAKQWIDKRSN